MKKYLLFQIILIAMFSCGKNIYADKNISSLDNLEQINNNLKKQHINKIILSIKRNNKFFEHKIFNTETIESSLIINKASYSFTILVNKKEEYQLKGKLQFSKYSSDKFDINLKGLGLVTFAYDKQNTETNTFITLTPVSTVVNTYITGQIILTQRKNKLNMLIYHNGKLKKDNLYETPISKYLEELSKKYGIMINSSVIKGFIYDDNDNSKYPRLDLSFYYKQPELENYFNTDNIYRMYGKKKGDQFLEFNLRTPDYASIIKKDAPFYPAMADLLIGHAYFPKSKFYQTVYYNKETRLSTGAGLEAILHEAIHIWHSNHFDMVKKLLNSKGSYYDRVRKTSNICKDYMHASEYLSSKDPICGFKNSEKAIIEILSKVKWPQRHGILTKRKYAYRLDDYKCKEDKVIIYNKLKYCIGANNVWNKYSELHSMDSDFEYFAILMQLFVFSRKDFEKIATNQEKIFAKYFFKQLH